MEFDLDLVFGPPAPTEKMTMDELESLLFPENEKPHGEEVIFDIDNYRYRYCNGVLETYMATDNQLVNKYECR